MLAVISSMTPSPNMRIPATAVAQSSKYCEGFRCDSWKDGVELTVNVNVTLMAFWNLYGCLISL